MSAPADKPACYCSFCGKSQDEVERLIAGPHVFICNECVALCNGILAEHKIAEAVANHMASLAAAADPAPISVWKRLFARPTTAQVRG